MATKKNAAGQKSQLANVVKKAAGGPGSSSSAPHWAQRGWDFAAQEMRRREIQQEEMAKGVRRFWIKDGTDTTITFIDDEPFMIREHNFQIDGKWGHYKTCMLGADDGQGCVFCEADNKPRFVAMFSVIDHTEYTSKDGKPMKNQIRLFAAGADTLKMLEKLRQKHGPLAGCVFEVSRAGDKSPGVGNMFQFVRRVNLKDPKVYKSYGFTAPPKPIDYDTVLKPMSRADAEAWLGRSGASYSAATGEVEY